jgi:hypothetical protein
MADMIHLRSSMLSLIVWQELILKRVCIKPCTLTGIQQRDNGFEIRVYCCLNSTVTKSLLPTALIVVKSSRVHDEQMMGYEKEVE